MGSHHKHVYVGVYAVSRQSSMLALSPIPPLRICSTRPGLSAHCLLDLPRQDRRQRRKADGQDRLMGRRI